MSKLNRQVTAALTSLATLVVAAPARAQDGQIEEIVVTARKRVENLQEVPDSITAFNEAMIEEHGRAFVVCAFVPGSGPDPAYERTSASLAIAFRVGPWLLARKDVVARRYCEAQRQRLSTLVLGGSPALAAELAEFDSACQLFG